jgi:hypothetical protein
MMPHSIASTIAVLALCLFPFAAACESVAQTAPWGLRSDSLIQVGVDRRLSIGADGFATIEPHLAAHPRNAVHLIAGVAVITKPDITERFCAALTSFDAGRTWARHKFPVKECLDPWVTIRRDGSAVFAMLSGSELLTFHSADGGRTWSERPVSFGRRHDHGTLAADTTQGAFAGSVYAVSLQIVRDSLEARRFAAFVARSSDAGVTFEEPARVIISNLQMNPMNPVVLSDGVLVVPLSDYGRTTADGEFSWLARGRDWVVTSSDGGRTFSAPSFVTESCARSFPQLAVDASAGPFRDRLYWVCNDSTLQSIYLHHSADRGERWSDPVLVNQNSGPMPHVRNAVIAVSRVGVVGISWYDARNDRDGSEGEYRCQEVFFTASMDGGLTFLPEEKVSSAKNCANQPGNGQVARRWPAGGDYHGLAAAADGRFHVVWADNRDGIYQLRTAVVAVNAKPFSRTRP